MFPAKLLSTRPDTEPGRGKSPDTRDTQDTCHQLYLTRVVQCTHRGQDEVPSAPRLLDQSQRPVISESRLREQFHSEPQKKFE